MNVIGLTGGIGTGKSTVSNYLRTHDIEIIDADEISRYIVQPGMPALEAIEKAFGPDILLPDGNMDRKKMAEIVFNDPAKKELLESITMPMIIGVITGYAESFKETNEPGIIIVDAPLLYEVGLDSICDYVWAVKADLETRVERVCQRDSATKEQVMARVKNQMNQEEILSKADEVIDNSGSLEALQNRIEELIEKYAK